MSEQHINPGELPCPVCGAEPQQRTWTNLMNDSHFRPFSLKHSIVGSQVNLLVCTICGYMQLFADPEDFRE